MFYSPPTLDGGNSGSVIRRKINILIPIPKNQDIDLNKKYLQINKLKMNHTIIAGDLNSNVIWDEWDRWWNHLDVARELSDFGIKSAYHEFRKEEQGKESISTLCFRKDKNKTYHIDYLFAPTQYLQNLDKVEIGEIEKWLEFSGHMPVICEFSNI